MQKLRSLHLYLGCLFAPLVIFFCISGIWQVLGMHYSKSSMLQVLSTLHTGRGLKEGVSLFSTPFAWLAVAMAVSLVGTIVLGVAMAFRYGHRRTTLVCLALGVAGPLGLILVLRSVAMGDS